MKNVAEAVNAYFSKRKFICKRMLELKMFSSGRLKNNTFAERRRSRYVADCTPDKAQADAYASADADASAPRTLLQAASRPQAVQRQ